MMHYVQLGVPKHLYDQLGLRPNQTITLRNSQSISELATNENTASTSNSSDPKPLNAQRGTDSKTVEDANEKMPLGTFQIIRVNPGNTPSTDSQKTLVQNPGTNRETNKLIPEDSLKIIRVNAGSGHKPETTAKLPDSQSSSEAESSEDDSENIEDDSDSSEDASARGMDCAAPVSDKPEIIRFVKEAGQHSPLQEGVAKHGLGKEAVESANYCGKCSRVFSSHASFVIHKKTCQDKKIPTSQPRKPISYPRVCPSCNRCYSNRSSYAHHQRLCKEFRRKQTCHNLQNIVQPLSSSKSHRLSSSKMSVGLDRSAKESQVLNEEDKPEKWIPVTNNHLYMNKFFVVKNS